MRVACPKCGKCLATGSNNSATGLRLRHDASLVSQAPGQAPKIKCHCGQIVIVMKGSVG